jgi:hypothetical protein
MAAERAGSKALLSHNAYRRVTYFFSKKNSESMYVKGKAACWSPGGERSGVEPWNVPSILAARDPFQAST